MIKRKGGGGEWGTQRGLFFLFKKKNNKETNSERGEALVIMLSPSRWKGSFLKIFF